MLLYLLFYSMTALINFGNSCKYALGSNQITYIVLNLIWNKINNICQLLLIVLFLMLN